MAFDCIYVDFQNKSHSTGLEIDFPFLKKTRFISSYLDILKSYLPEIRTKHFWFLTSLVDYKNFDFDFIPEQHQINQAHAWSSTENKEGDTFLFNTNELREQINDLKFLRDLKDINYHESQQLVYHDWPIEKFQLGDLVERVKSQKHFCVHYALDNTESGFRQPSFWDGKKIHVYDKKKTMLTVPKININNDLYDHGKIVFENKESKTIPLDIFFLHNNEKIASANLSRLETHCEKISKKITTVSGIKGRTQAIQEVAKRSTSDYFYLVPAKIEVSNTFNFAFVPDTMKSPRHYIFDCHNTVIDYSYGHQAVVLYNKKLCLDTSEDVIDFTMARPHEHVRLLSGNSTFYEDDVVCYRTTFRELVKLFYYDHTKPTVENTHIIKKWQQANHSIVKKACLDAERFVQEKKFDITEIKKTYDWNFVDLFFKSLA